MSDPTRINMAYDPRVQRMSGQAIHGNTPFDVPLISHIEGNLWQGGCMDGLILPEEIKHVVSLYPWERYRTVSELDSFLEVRLYDSDDMPSPSQLYAIADWINTCLASAPTLVHCQAGLNRSSLTAGLALVRGGMPAEEAIALLREKRSPACLCNRAFESWLREQTWAMFEDDPAR